MAAILLTAQAQVPGLLNYQGKITSGAAAYSGSGQLKFALVDATAATTVWSHDGSSSAGSEPTSALSLMVSKGLFSVQLGDTALANMTAALPASVFSNPPLRLRVWFSDGTGPFQLIGPDKPFTSSGYALRAGSLTPAGLAAVSKASEAGVKAAIDATAAVPASTPTEQAAKDAILAAMRATLPAPAPAN
ncbi:MAG: hypothetical protein NTV80_03460 [Verrucomicrobia bacterium]|nr:hypothetical protein [Verrucomicrobiota bacterium]